MPFTLAEEPKPKHADDSVHYLEHGLAMAGHLAAHARVRSLALADLTLPPPVLADEQAHLRALASLYLLSQLENASLLPAIELLAGLSVSGGMQVDLGSAASRLMEFWRHHSERFSATERRHLFDRVFDSEFESLMIDLCEGLYKLDEGVLVPRASNPLNQAKVRTTAESLAEHLLNHTHAESEFSANEILTETHAATEILKDPGMEHAFGARTIWKTVEAILRRYGTPVPDFDSYVTRGRAGMTILSWLADARAIPPTSNTTLVALDHPVIGAAVDWLQASLEVEQSKSGDGPPGAAGGSRGTKGA